MGLVETQAAETPPPVVLMGRSGGWGLRTSISNSADAAGPETTNQVPARGCRAKAVIEPVVRNVYLVQVYPKAR